MNPVLYRITGILSTCRVVLFEVFMRKRLFCKSFGVK
jgi:hypothetical protein